MLKKDCVFQRKIKKREKGIDKGRKMGYNNEAVRESGGAEARRDSLEKVLKKALDKRTAK